MITNKKLAIMSTIIYIVGMIVCGILSVNTYISYIIRAGALFVVGIIFMVLMSYIKGNTEEIKNRSIIMYSSLI